MYFLIIFIIYPICSSLPTSFHPFYVTHQTATSHYVLTTSSAVALLQSTNTPFLQPIRLCGTLSFVNGPVQLICFTSSFIVTFQIHLTRVRNSANPCVRDMSKSLRTCQMSVHGYPVDMSIFCNLQLGLL